MSNYLDIISAARATTDHLSQTSPNHAQTQLVISEPSISDTSTLPIMPRPDTATSTTGAEGADAERLSLPSQSRSKRITILDGLSWMLGRGNVGVVSAGTCPLSNHRTAILPSSFALHSSGPFPYLCQSQADIQPQPDHTTNHKYRRPRSTSN